MSYFLAEFDEIEDDKAVRKAYLENKAETYGDYFTSFNP